MILNLHEYEFRSGQGKRTDLCPNEQKLDTAKILADEAGISRVQMVRLKEVKRKRPDLFEKVFDGSYTIGKAHAEMKLDENPPTTEEERQEELNERSTFCQRKQSR